MYLQNTLNDILELLHFHFWLIFSKYLMTRYSLIFYCSQVLYAYLLTSVLLTSPFKNGCVIYTCIYKYVPLWVSLLVCAHVEVRNKLEISSFCSSHWILARLAISEPLGSPCHSPSTSNGVTEGTDKHSFFEGIGIWIQPSLQLSCLLSKMLLLSFWGRT